MDCYPNDMACYHSMLQLLETARLAAPTQITGHWQPVRMCLDVATQEWLNVGIFFRANDGSTIWRMVRNFSGIRCLYDDDAADTARFLVEQTESALQAQMMLPAGWNISLGPQKFVRGTSAHEIISALFDRLVPLARHEISQGDRLDREEHNRSTPSVRAAVGRLIRERLQLARKHTPDFWRREPEIVRRGETDIQVDLQVKGLAGDTAVHGAVASAWYKTQYHRNASLGHACNAVAAACQAWPQSKNILYLLQPPADAHALSAKDHTEIQAEIDTNRWLLSQHGGEVRIATAETDMAADILRDLRLLPAIA